MTAIRRLSAAHDKRRNRIDAMAMSSRQAIIARVDRLIATECDGLGFWFGRPGNRGAK
jgi:hypothetical protein